MPNELRVAATFVCGVLLLVLGLRVRLGLTRRFATAYRNPRLPFHFRNGALAALPTAIWFFVATGVGLALPLHRL